MKKSSEEIDYERNIEYDKNVTRFINALQMNNYTWKQCSDILVRHQLLRHQFDKFDRRSKKTVVKYEIPSKMDFIHALERCGVPREFMQEQITTDYVTCMNILERAYQVEKNPDSVQMLDIYIAKGKKEEEENF